MLLLHNNQLSGSIPKCVGELSNLVILNLYFNSWDGFVSEYHFVNLTKLTGFAISSKSDLELKVSSNWAPPFQLEYIYISRT